MSGPIEGGSTAYCAECQESGHYQTAHHMSGPRPYYRPGWGWLR